MTNIVNAINLRILYTCLTLHSGLNGAGGGGGSSFARQDIVASVAAVILVPQVYITYVNDTCADAVVYLPRGGDMGNLNKFVLELTEGSTSLDYKYLDTIGPDKISMNTSMYTGTDTFCGLSPLTTYSLIAIPYFTMGRGMYSPRVVFTTLCRPLTSYWEPLVPRRYSTAGIGRGFTDPVMNAPNLEVGVEVFTSRTSVNPLRYADPPTSVMPMLPNARMGQTMTNAVGYVYMFGGRTDGKYANDHFLLIQGELITLHLSARTLILAPLFHLLYFTCPMMK
jgi:hypothetical protein